eukprot:757447-Hanusia_phi.AAC.1
MSSLTATTSFAPPRYPGHLPISLFVTLGRCAPTLVIQLSHRIMSLLTVITCSSFLLLFLFSPSSAHHPTALSAMEPFLIFHDSYIACNAQSDPVVTAAAGPPGPARWLTKAHSGRGIRRS